MSDPRILLCAPALDAAESQAGLDMLRDIELPNATKFIVTTGKFDAQKVARTFNVEANYPSEPARLLSFARWACGAIGPEPRFRDGYDLFCLDGILEQNGGFDFAVLVRDAAGLEQRWLELRASVAGALFLTFGPQSAECTEAADTANVVFNLTHAASRPFRDHVHKLYNEGGFYSLDDYRLDKALQLAVESMRLEEALRERLGNWGGDMHSTGSSAQSPSSDRTASSFGFVSV